MLIEAPFKNGDVVALKLTSGEELVGKLEEEKTDSYKIKTPLTLVIGQQGIGLKQYLLTGATEKAYNFTKDKVITTTKTIKQFSDFYQQQTSGLVTAPA